jgi:hypothetical protein
VTRFSECFLLVFGQLAVGGMIALAVPPFAMLERGFYKSSAGVFVGFGVLYLAGAVALAVRVGSPGSGQIVRLVLWGAFVALSAAYLATLWGDSGPRRARTFLASLTFGLAALCASATAYRPGPLLSLTTLVYPVGFVASALVLGAVAVGMLLGHWYLIDLGLSIEPLRRLLNYFVGVLLLQLVAGVLVVGALALTKGPGAAAVITLWHDHGTLLALRVLLGPAAALVMAFMIHRTLLIPQTMAATGLFYVATLAVMMGEILGRLVLFRTSLPL